MDILLVSGYVYSSYAFRHPGNNLKIGSGTSGRPRSKIHLLVHFCDGWTTVLGPLRINSSSEPISSTTESLKISIIPMSSHTGK